MHRSVDANGIITTTLACGAEIYDLTCVGSPRKAIDRMVSLNRRTFETAHSTINDNVTTSILGVK